MEAHVRAGVLLDQYGALLTPRQRAILSLYFDQDLSLGEIAQQEGITRQGVHDMIRRGEKQMEAWESELHLLEQARKRRNTAKQMRSLLEQLTLPAEQQAVRTALLNLLDELDGETEDQAEIAEGELHGI